MQLADTIKVDGSKSVLLTEGARSTKDTLFFLTPEEDEKPKKSERKPPVQPKSNGTPLKSKTVAGKVLRNQRRAKQEEDQSHLQRFIEHQRELHQKVQNDGLERYSHGSGGKGGEDKTWKKFQSYKGEMALPPEVERLRVSCRPLSCNFVFLMLSQGLRRSQGADRHSADQWVRGAVPCEHH